MNLSIAEHERLECWLFIAALPTLHPAAEIIFLSIASLLYRNRTLSARMRSLTLLFHHYITPATVVAVNDPFLTPEYAAYQFQYDSVHGGYPEEVKAGDGCLIIGKTTVKFFSERNPAGTYDSMLN